LAADFEHHRYVLRNAATAPKERQATMEEVPAT
jgi:hypothetical protein